MEFGRGAERGGVGGGGAGLEVGGERVGGGSFFASSFLASVAEASKNFNAAAFSSSSVYSGLHLGQWRLSLSRNHARVTCSFVV